MISSASENKKELLYIIKIGGNVIDDKKSLDLFLKDFSSIKNNKILVHGGGKIATAIGDKLGIQSKYVDGRRITDDETIDLVTMVYGGLLNKKIVTHLQSMKCNAIGIFGADANIIPAKKRPIKAIDYGWVGDINTEKIDATMLQLFISNHLVPVIAPLTHDGDGHILNTNADTITAALGIALSVLYNVQLIYCFEKNGVLSDVNDESSVVSELQPHKYTLLKQSNRLFAGILPKIDNAFDAIDKGVDSVTIGSSDKLNELIGGKSGTKIFA